MGYLALEKFNIEIGQKIIYVEDFRRESNKERRLRMINEPKYIEISKIGRKYFYLGSLDYKIDKESFESPYENFEHFLCFESMDKFNEYLDNFNKIDEIKEMVYYGAKNLSLCNTEEINVIYNILKSKQEG